MEKLLLYCTKSKPYLIKDPLHFDENDNLEIKFLTYNNSNYLGYEQNGKIVGECECDLVEEIKYTSYEHIYFTNTLDTFDEKLLQQSCLEYDALDDYLKEDKGYALHLKNVKIFDESKRLDDYYNKETLPHDYWLYPNVFKVKKAPQNMMLVYDEKGNKYILLPIHPKFIAKIMNGEKTIEVRRKILNSLKELIK